MTLAILHLSDIHIQDEGDPVLKRSKKIAAAVNPYLPDASFVVILLTGDIAQTGARSEYVLANQFIEDIVREIKAEKELPIQVIVAPGNHDCDFNGDQEGRQAILAAVHKKVGNIPESFIAAGIAVQHNFAEFRDQFDSAATVGFEDPLWRCYTVEVEGARIIFDVLNASRMSSRHEQQGGLLFPYERYLHMKQTDADLRFVALHHPFNWYSQSNYLAFKEFIHRLADVVVTGHERHATDTWRASVGLCVNASERNIVVHVVKATRRLGRCRGRLGSCGGSGRA